MQDPQPNTTATTSHVSLKGVTRKFSLGGNEINALSDFTHDFEAGQMVIIAGPSGSGKSTLLNIIGCIDKPDSGTVVIDGVDVTDITLERLSNTRREKIGFIFQNFNLIPVLTAYENVEMALLFSDLSPDTARDYSIEALKAVGLESRMDHRPAQLSGGQRQRVAIARALAGRPKIVVADEPTASLDSRTAEEIINLLSELNVAFGASIFVATHDQKLIQTSDRTLNLRDGRIV